MRFTPAPGSSQRVWIVWVATLVGVVAITVMIQVVRRSEGDGPVWLAIGGALLIAVVTVGAFFGDRAERREQRRPRRSQHRMTRCGGRIDETAVV